MESNGHSHPVDAPATKDAPMSYVQNGGRQRPFTVDEALAFSPMASVIPFNTGNIYHFHIFDCQLRSILYKIA